MLKKKKKKDPREWRKLTRKRGKCVNISICKLCMVVLSLYATESVCSPPPSSQFSNLNFSGRSHVVSHFFHRCDTCHVVTDLVKTALTTNMLSRLSNVRIRNKLDYKSLFVPSHLEWVASPGPSDNIGAKRSEVGVGQEKLDKNANISTVSVAVLSSLSDTISLSFSPIYSESGIHPSSESSTLCSLSSSTKSIHPMLQKN